MPMAARAARVMASNRARVILLSFQHVSGQCQGRGCSSWLYRFHPKHTCFWAGEGTGCARSEGRTKSEIRRRTADYGPRTTGPRVGDSWSLVSCLWSPFEFRAFFDLRPSRVVHSVAITSSPLKCFGANRMFRAVAIGGAAVAAMRACWSVTTMPCSPCPICSSLSRNPGTFP
jgi:hypothetical protein